MRSIRSWTIAARSACAALAGAAPTAAAPPALGNGSSMQPDILATGRFVVFASTATNLAPCIVRRDPLAFSQAMIGLPKFVEMRFKERAIFRMNDFKIPAFANA